MFRVCIVVVTGNRTLGMVWCYGNPRNLRYWCLISTWSKLDVALSVILRKAFCWSVESWIMCWNCFRFGSSPPLKTVFSLHVGSCTFDLVDVRVRWRHYWIQCPVVLYPHDAFGCLCVLQWPGTMGSIVSDLPAQTWRHLKSYSYTCGITSLRGWGWGWN